METQGSTLNINLQLIRSEIKATTSSSSTISKFRFPLKHPCQERFPPQKQYREHPRWAISSGVTLSRAVIRAPALRILIDQQLFKSLLDTVKLPASLPSPTHQFKVSFFAAASYVSYDIVKTRFLSRRYNIGYDGGKKLPPGRHSVVFLLERWGKSEPPRGWLLSEAKARGMSMLVISKKKAFCFRLCSLAPQLFVMGKVWFVLLLVLMALFDLNQHILGNFLQQLHGCKTLGSRKYSNI